MTAKHTPATPLPPLARMAGEHDPFAILGAVVPRGAPMRALLQLHDDRAKLVEALRLIAGDVDECNGKGGDGYVSILARAQTLLRELGEE
jgi:hypothetical protein